MATDPKQLEGGIIPRVEIADKTPEIGVEVGIEKQPRNVEAISVAPTESVVTTPEPANNVQHFTRIPEIKPPPDELRKQIEDILADKTIMAIYEQLPDSKKMIFRTKGESLAQIIADAIRSRRLVPHMTLKGIREWLSIIPNINKYYLLQEAKLDLDQIINVSEETAIAA